VPLSVEVVTPEREVSVCDDATLVVARGVEGEVGLMPGHTPMLIALSVGVLAIVHADGRRDSIAVDGGFLQISRDQVIVLAEYAALPAEIDPAATQAEIDELKRRIAAEAENAALKKELARAELVHAVSRM
jgi:F-type H+-transporting ATPase subunit epsilon